MRKTHLVPALWLLVAVARAVCLPDKPYLWAGQLNRIRTLALSQ
jgi:hypothetical protein